MTMAGDGDYHGICQYISVDFDADETMQLLRRNNLLRSSSNIVSFVRMHRVNRYRWCTYRNVLATATAM